ncbi:amino acid/polyamine/organocation transporter, APC superfamily [Congregibacter litoralis KT71]|uniref:Amino acid/polyamine/organocation transporter, APC superfamily n=2 Tax=Congregibacter TaxID=393661 RepID=A4A478_9GAMM|nr:amino acid/polyamine/organocation transporter, APC superfamily [Congregibacter litoralis KT71]
MQAAIGVSATIAFMSNHRENRLRRDIGSFGAAFLVLNGLIGAGIFALPGKVAVNAGLFSPWLFLVVGALFLSVVLVFAELASYYDETGGPVLYASDAFGPLAGFGTGWLLFLSRTTAFAANATVMASYLGSLFDVLAGDLPRMLIITTVILGLTWANILGVRDGVRAMGVFTFLKAAPLLILVLLGFQYVSGSTLLPSAELLVDDLGSTTLLMIYAFVGFETVGVTAGETTHPRRTLPRVLVGTVVSIGLLYFLIVLVFVSVIDQGDYANATLVDVGRALAGTAGAFAITLAAVFSIGGNLAGSMLAAPRLVFSLAENRQLPRWFAHVHPRYATPDRCIVVMGALALGLALTGSFVKLAVASSVARLLSYIICIASLPAIRRGASDAVRQDAYRLKGGYLIPVLGLMICLWLLMQSKAESWIAVGVLLLAGFAFYAFEKRFGLAEQP